MPLTGERLRAAQSTSPAAGRSWRIAPEDQPVDSPITNQPKAMIPTAKMVSPMERSQRKTSRTGVCRNSAERAYRMPCSKLAQVWARPTGSRLISAISASPTLTDQKANGSEPVRHCVRMVSRRRLNSVSPSPKLPSPTRRISQSAWDRASRSDCVRLDGVRPDSAASTVPPPC